MTPEERIAALEARQAGTEAWLKDIDQKLDRLLEAAAMGRGAWWAVVKIGGFLVLVLSGLSWLIERLHFITWTR